jgi:hypothetical protein
VNPSDCECGIFKRIGSRKGTSRERVGESTGKEGVRIGVLRRKIR